MCADSQEFCCSNSTIPSNSQLFEMLVENIRENDVSIFTYACAELGFCERVFREVKFF